MSSLAGSVQVALLRNPRYLHLRLPGKRQLSSLKSRWGQSYTATVHVGRGNGPGGLVFVVDRRLSDGHQTLDIRRAFDSCLDKDSI